MHRWHRSKTPGSIPGSNASGRDVGPVGAGARVKRLADSQKEAAHVCREEAQGCTRPPWANGGSSSDKNQSAGKLAITNWETKGREEEKLY